MSDLFKKAYLPKQEPPKEGTYFCVWEVGDTHWTGAGIWNGKKFKEEKVKELKGLQPTYWLREVSTFSKSQKAERFTNQALGEAQEYPEVEMLYA